MTGHAQIPFRGGIEPRTARIQHKSICIPRERQGCSLGATDAGANQRWLITTNTCINTQRLPINKHSLEVRSACLPFPKDLAWTYQICHGPNYEWQKQVLKKQHQNFSRKGHILVILDYPQWKAVNKQLVANWKGLFNLLNPTHSNWARYLIQLSVTAVPLPVGKGRGWTAQEHK